MRLRASVTLTALIAAASLAACSESEEPRNAAINEDLNTDTANAPAQTAGANSFTEDQARGQVENAGYENVSDMTLTTNGLWQGTAMRGGETVNVSVDYRGAVTSNPGGAAPPVVADRDADTAVPGALEQGTPASATAQDPGGAYPADARRAGERR